MTDPKKARCWDKTWKYTPKDATDLKATFKRIRREMKEAEAVRESANVQPIRVKGK